MPPSIVVNEETGVIGSATKPEGYLPGYRFLIDDVSSVIGIESLEATGGLDSEVYLCVSDDDPSLLETVILPTRTGINDLHIFDTFDHTAGSPINWSIPKSNYSNATAGTEVIFRFVPKGSSSIFQYYSGDRVRSPWYHTVYYTNFIKYGHWFPGFVRLLINPETNAFGYEDWTDGNYVDLVANTTGMYAAPIERESAGTVAFNFFSDTILGVAPTTVTFTSVLSRGTVASWQWFFGDGASSTEKNPTHTYTSAGTYSVILKATSTLGDIVTVSKANMISVGILNFVASPQRGPSPLTTTFNDESVVPTEYETIERTWNFGDGSATVLATSPTHVYVEPGSYNVSLTSKIRKS